jgi:hypothetical protein
LGFLGSPRFAAKTLEYGYWIYLDFLGFSRADRDSSMGYADKSEKLLSFRFWRRARAIGRTDPNMACGRNGVLIGSSLTRLLIFCKKLPALIALAVGGRSVSSNFRFSVMAGLDPAIHENTESGDQVIDNVS